MKSTFKKGSKYKIDYTRTNEEEEFLNDMLLYYIINKKPRYLID